MNVGGDINTHVALDPVKVELSVNTETLIGFGLIGFALAIYGVAKYKRK